MNNETFQSILSIGETVAVEFKRCGNGIEHDTYESVCSFLNCFGGELGQEYSDTIGTNPDTIDTIPTLNLVSGNIGNNRSGKWQVNG